MNTTFFETIKCNDFEIYNLNYHKKRIANTIGKNIHLEEYIYPPNDNLLKCKFIYDYDDIIDIEFRSYTPKDINSFQLIHDDTISYKTKSLDRTHLDSLYTKRKNADEIIIVKDKLITDTSIANIAIELDGIWFTPKTPLLYGTTRERYLDNGILKELDITVDILKESNKIAILNAMIDFKIIENITIYE